MNPLNQTAMGPGKDEILQNTHYGLNIYAFILRSYYPDETVLSLSGRDCSPAKNPFNNDKPTLLVKIIDGCAIHTDVENAIVAGNAFDFASLFYSMEGQDLLDKINEDLNLRLTPEKPIQYPMLSNILPNNRGIALKKSPVFSYFNKPVSNIIPARKVTLLEVYYLVKGYHFALSTKTLREVTDMKEARKYKAQHFDYVTFSGLFSQRNDVNLIRHSGLLTVDFDHVDDIQALKKSLLNDAYFETELLFVSPSGDGLKWIIPIDLSQVKHRDYFKAVANYLQQSYNLHVDQSGKDISRACFLPYDPEIFIHSKYL